jgi:hypothetical protein
MYIGYTEHTPTYLLTVTIPVVGLEVFPVQSTPVVSLSNASYTLVKSYPIELLGFHLQHPEFDPLGVVDLESTRTL